ncbi:hypothetical protein ACVWXN_000172 [Bradyrhizobium sp. i1.4.4]|uniref:DUF6894 domain-containing protein n=1 Tax=Bradyrhizobium japonicum TaxID=375 RepID=A0A1Y2JXU0_BRAJP|nr:hypothetical protein BSZ19_01670 [Bradyrhizobium japonicum]
MPRYFFKVLNLDPTTDVQSEDLPDDEAAWREATVYAGQLFKDIDGKLRPGKEWGVEVTDEAGKANLQHSYQYEIQEVGRLSPLGRGGFRAAVPDFALRKLTR